MKIYFWVRPSADAQAVSVVVSIAVLSGRLLDRWVGWLPDEKWA